MLLLYLFGAAEVCLLIYRFFYCIDGCGPYHTRATVADRILLNNGNGAFVDSGQRLDNPRKAGSAASGAVALGDLDGDNDLDAVVATSKGASIWMNQGGAQGGQTGIFT